MLETTSIINKAIWHYSKDNSFEKEILFALHTLLNKHFVKYHLEQTLVKEPNFLLNNDTFQRIFSTCHRKEKGIYYTPAEVADYIISNTIIANTISVDCMFSIDMALDILLQMGQEFVQKLVFQRNFFDPTCGSGEFLLSVINLKIKLALKSGFSLTDFDYIKICQSVKGNDIEDESIDIAKMRIFFAISPYLKSPESFNELAQTLNQCFFDKDFVLESSQIQHKFDYIIGNPPFIEYAKYERKDELLSSYGNIYADVIARSLAMLKQNGGLGFVLPLSYISTTRMQRIRTLVKENCERQIILSFADRPDCLFVGAHQKINILIVKKGNKACKTYTSNYKHWYKNERKLLLNGRQIIATNIEYNEFIPKIGNEIELSIYNKIHSLYAHNLISLQKQDGKGLYLNMRACFWIKAFSFSQNSKEYKVFYYDENMRDFILCVLNSSLFWVYWGMVSDCWHLTQKELKHFSVPNKIQNTQIYQKLAQKLEKKLEKTKVYIKTAQTDYEYKHKMCKKEIDDIDNELALIYKLTPNELQYIQNFALKYRMGDNASV